MCRNRQIQLTHNVEKSYPVVIDPEMTRLMELVEKKIKSGNMTVLCMFRKLGERLNKEMENIKHSLIKYQR